MLIDRMWEEPDVVAEAGPSSHQPSRQGYCGYCRLLYSNLDQVAAGRGSPEGQLTLCGQSGTAAQ